MGKSLNIKAPRRFSDNFGDPFREILKIVDSFNQDQTTDSIHVDFKENKFSGPFYLGPLSSILFNLKSLGQEINIEHSSSYLTTICFPYGVQLENQSIEEITNKLQLFTQKTYIHIIHFSTDKTPNQEVLRTNIISTINTILKEQLKLPTNIISAFYYFIDELTQNIIHHSESVVGTIFCQFYPEKNYVDLTICDSGKGILQSYIDSGKFSPKSNDEAINFAIYGKSTKNLPNNESRGYGLSTTRNMLVNGLKGQFLLYSGNSFFIHTNAREEIIALPKFKFFKGNMVNLRIPVFNISDFSIYNYISH